MPKFSIIVPVYNVENYIKKCVDSILAQSFSDFELILVDDGSPDRCPEICDEYEKKDPRIKVFHIKNSGPSEARNFGINAAVGEYCWLVDSDDCISSDALEKIYPYANGENDIINIGYICYADGKEPDFNSPGSKYKHSGTADKKTVCSFMNSACSSHLLPFAWRYIFKLKFLKENKISFNNDLRFAEDSVFNTEALLQAEKVFFAEICVYGHCSRLNSLSQKCDNDFNIDFLNYCILYDNLRDEIYEKYCAFPDERYYEDAGKFIITSIYVYALLNRLYYSSSRNNFFLFKKISKTDMIKKAFSRFDLNSIKSKSLEWFMFRFVKQKLYFPAFIIYRFFIFK